MENIRDAAPRLFDEERKGAAGMQNDVVLTMRGISKLFPGTRALDNVDFTLRRGEIHALMGENGAGKSTLIKVLTGVYEKDGGSIHIEGIEGEAPIHSPQDAQNAGHQHGVSGDHPVPEPDGGGKHVHRPDGGDRSPLEGL